MAALASFARMVGPSTDTEGVQSLAKAKAVSRAAPVPWAALATALHTLRAQGSPRATGRVLGFLGLLFLSSASSGLWFARWSGRVFDGLDGLGGGFADVAVAALEFVAQQREGGAGLRPKLSEEVNRVQFVF